jgi:hypothetical protein
VKIRHIGFSLVPLAAYALVGCAAPPKVELIKFDPPKSVVIEQIPPMRTGAQIGFEPQRPFAESGDRYFVDSVDPASPGDFSRQANDATIRQITTSPTRISPATGAAVGLAGGIVGGLIQLNAEETQRRALGFHAKVLEKYPAWNPGAELIRRVQVSLEQQGIRVAIEPAAGPPRPRWPVPDELGYRFETRTLNAPGVDADLYVQIAPGAMFRAIGPLNSYEPSTHVMLLIFEGRTGRFLRKEFFFARPPGSKLSYATLSALEQGIGEAIPPLTEALLSLVPQVVQVVSARDPAAVKP